jgi:hypothetical protein
MSVAVCLPRLRDTAFKIPLCSDLTFDDTPRRTSAITGPFTNSTACALLGVSKGKMRLYKNLHSVQERWMAKKVISQMDWLVCKIRHKTLNSIYF